MEPLQKTYTLWGVHKESHCRGTLCIRNTEWKPLVPYSSLSVPREVNGLYPWAHLPLGFCLGWSVESPGRRSEGWRRMSTYHTILGAIPGLFSAHVVQPSPLFPLCSKTSIITPSSFLFFLVLLPVTEYALVPFGFPASCLQLFWYSDTPRY